MQKQQTKSNTEIEVISNALWLRINLSSFKYRQNQLSELGTSIQIKRSNIQKDLHLLAPTIVFD
jgi:hypothetical protein